MNRFNDLINLKFCFSSFPSHEANIEYMKIKVTNAQAFFQVIATLLVMMSAFTLIDSISSHSFFLLPFILVFLLLCVIILKYRMKFFSYTNLLTTLFCFVLTCYGYFSVKDNILLPECRMAFYLGHTFGVFERIVIQELSHIKHKFIFSLLSLAMNFIFAPIDNIPLIIYRIFLLMLTVLIDIRREKGDRAIFKGFYDYREELTKFKTLLVSGLPTNIIILSRNLRQSLFANKCFHQTFQISTIEMNWVPQEWLAGLTIDKESSGNIIAKDIIRDENLACRLTGLQLLDILNQNQLLTDQDQKFCFNAEYVGGVVGGKRRFEITMFSLLWDGQDAVAMVLNDVSEQYMNLTLKIADINKDKMIATVSHELRTPLNCILGMIKIIEGQVSSREVLTYLNVCKNSGKLLLNLVNSILDLGQIRNNSFHLNITRGDLRELLEEIYCLFDYQFQEKGISLKFEVDPNTPQFLETDQNRLRQVIINLIGNAFKFTFKGGVHVYVEPEGIEGEYVRIKVTDTGIGIKDEDKGKLFKMYGRLEQPDQTTNTEGVGLGLTISEHLVKLLSGGKEESMKVDSCYGAGTTFSFVIRTNLNTVLSAIDSNNEVDLNDKEDVGALDEYQDLSVKLSSYNMIPNLSKRLSMRPVREEIIGIPKVKGHRRKRSSSIWLSPVGDSAKSGLDMSSSNISILRNEEDFVTRGKECKGNVLLVDDSPFNLMVAKHIVEGLGYRAKTALNGKLAVEMVKKSNKDGIVYKAIFMDCQMPVMDGYQATRVLRGLMESREVHEIPIIALSANDEEDDKRKCKEAGMCHHLAKPVDEQEIKKALSRFCGH